MTSKQPTPYISSMEERKSLARNWFDRQINVEEMFACAICHNTIDLDHPIHCPECSKLFCGDCIDKWLNNHTLESIFVKRCPCCQVQVDVNNFVYCRVYQDVHEVIDNLRNKLDELIELINRPLYVCEQHGKEIQLFCKACNECLCIKCVIGEPHRRHIDNISELNEARQKFKAMIEGEHSFLADRLTVLSKAGDQIAANECDMMEANDNTVEEMNWASERIVEKIRDEMGERFKQHIEPVKAVTRQQRNEVEMIMRKASELADKETSPQVMMETFKMVDAIKKLHKEPLPQLELPDPAFINPITPPFVELRFSMRRFSEKIVLCGSILSEKESIEGFTLQLKGHQDQDENGNDVIRLSLLVIEGYDVHDVKVICYPIKGVSVEPLARRMDLKENEDNTVLEFSEFKAMEGFLEDSTDALYLRLKFRLWATYYDKCVHKDWYIGKLAGIKQELAAEHSTRY